MTRGGVEAGGMCLMPGGSFESRAFVAPAASLDCNSLQYCVIIFNGFGVSVHCLMLCYSISFPCFVLVGSFEYILVSHVRCDQMEEYCIKSVDVGEVACSLCYDPEIIC